MGCFNYTLMAPTGAVALYNIPEDPNETTEVSGQNPAVVARLTARLKFYAQSDDQVGPALSPPPPTPQGGGDHTGWNYQCPQCPQCPDRGAGPTNAPPTPPPPPPPSPPPTPITCSPIEHHNNIAGAIPHLGASTRTVKYLGNRTTDAECMHACTANSTVAAQWGGGCYGRHDNVWTPTKVTRPISSAVSCRFPPKKPGPTRLSYNPWCDNATCVPGPPPPNMPVSMAIAAAVGLLAAAGPAPIEHIHDESAGDIYGTPWWWA